MLPLLLILFPRTRSFYSRYREYILACVFLSVVQWTVHTKHYMDSMPPAVFTRPLYVHGFSYIGVLALLYQVRFFILCPLVISCFLIDAVSMLPVICSEFYPGSSIWSCAAYDVVRVGVLVVALPLALVRVMEKRSRELFQVRLSHRD